MDRFEVAQRRYRDIVSEQFAAQPRAERSIKMPTAALKVWLTQYVVGAIEEIYDRPRFRELATWSSRTLAAGVQTTERAAVERVDQALCAAAKATGRLTRNQLVKRQLEVMAESPHTSDTPYGAEVRAARMFAHIPYYTEQLPTIAQRAWTDLVCRRDYLGPVGGMMDPEPLPEGATEGMFVVSLQPALFFVGDSITRCLLQRIKAWMSLLVEARYVVHAAIHAVGRSYEQQMAAEEDAWQELQSSRGEVEYLCLTGNESHLREACVSAVQVYAEFHPSPDLGWLGLEDQIIQHFRGRLRHNIFGSRDLETTDRIAGSLGELRLLYRGMSPDRSATDEAIATGGFVLVDKETRREAYWQGKRLETDWFQYEKPWGMLVKLALSSRREEAVSWHDLYLEGPPNSTMASRWGRLKIHLPATLAKYVKPGGKDTGTYRLTLRGDQVHVIGADHSR